MRRRMNRNQSGRGGLKSSVAVYVARYSPLGLIGLAGLMMLFSFSNPDFMRGTRHHATDMAAPFIATVGQPFRMVADMVGNVTGLTQLRAENERLRMENTSLQEWYQTALMLRAENASLKDLLNVTPEPQQGYISTQVIADSGTTFVKSLLIKAGSEQGVQKGQAVLAGQGMIGRVIETGLYASRVLLLTDINSRIPVKIEGSSHKSILAGMNDDMPVLDHLPGDAALEAGAHVLSSNIGGNFPEGLPIGEVIKQDGLFKVRLFSDGHRTGFVQVIEKPDDPNVRQSINQLITPPELPGDVTNQTAKSHSKARGAE